MIIKDMEYIYLYKYLPPKAWALKVISEQTIKFTHPKDFNDPFDCIVSVENWIVTSKIFRKNYPNEMPPSPSNSILEAQAAKNRLKQFNFFRDGYEKIGLLCLSENPLNILMWSHYSKNHTGFVVEFKLPIEENHTNSYIWDKEKRIAGMPVKYGKDFHFLNIIPTPIDKVKSIIFSKYDIWEYEKEVRILNEKFGILSYPSQNLVSVIAGVNICENYFKVLKNVCINTGKKLDREIKLHHARRKKNSYCLEVPNYPKINNINSKL